MPLTETQAAKILLVRSVEECDGSVFSEQALSDALDAAKDERPGLDWIEKRSCCLFDKLSAWHQSIIQLAKAPANWTLPVCLLALILGLSTNLLGATEKIHVIRNPVFFLAGWNLLVYLGLLFVAIAKKRTRPGDGLIGHPAPSPQRESDVESPREPRGSIKVPWPARYLMPRIWQFVHKVMFGFHQTRNLANLTSRFAAHWFAVAGSLVAARWRYLLHLAALSIAAGAVVGMYFRGLFQGFEFIWASTFITEENTVAGFVHVVFAPSLLISSLFDLGLSERIEVARLMTPQGDASDAWVHLLAITVVLTVAIPRTLLALWQVNAIKSRVNAFGLALDDYYGEVIETPIRSIIAKEVETAASRFAKNVAAYVGASLYAEMLVPRLREFREQGGSIANLRAELTELTESFAPQLKAYLQDRAIPAFQLGLSQRIGKIVKAIGTDFVSQRDPEAVLHNLKIAVPESAELGVSDHFSKAVGVSVGTAIALSFATIGGGLGQELGVAIIAALLGTTGPVGFVIGLVLGGVVAAGAWWFGKEKITEAVENVKLPATIVRTALWESRFEKLVAEGQSRSAESVQAKIRERLTPLVPKITDDIMVRIRSLWGA